MFAKLATYTFLGFLALLLLLWLLTGGITKTISIARTLSNPLQILRNPTAAIALFKLPRQPNFNLGVNSFPNGIPDDTSLQETQTPTQTQTFAQQSSYHGRVSLQQRNVSANDVSKQYLLILVAPVGSAVNFDGWSLQSAIYGTRVFLPQAASPYVLGAINAPSTIYAEPGSTLVVVSGASPVGVSFHETICTGYLNELFNFSPSLPATQCPQPLQVHKYGSECIAYATTLPACHYPRQLPTFLSAQCRSYLASTLTYRSCTDTYQLYPQFYSSSWRLYLGFSTPPWNSDHDTIRLLDQYGQIVDAISY